MRILSRMLTILLMVWMAGTATAQNSGGSFGGSRGFGGGSSSGGGGGGGGSFGGNSGSGTSWADQNRAREVARQQAEAQRQREIERRRQAALARERAAERARQAEIARQAELARLAAELERVRAMPLAERAAYAPYFRPLVSAPVTDPPSNHTAPVARLRPADPPSLLLVDPALVRRDGFDGSWNAGIAGSALALPPFMFLGLRLRRSRRKRKRRKYLAQFERRGRCEVMRLSLVFRPTVRARLQAELKRLAASFDMSTAAGMHGAARAVVELLAVHANDAAGATWSSRRETSQGAQRRFDVITRDLKARYRHDVVRSKSDEQYKAAAHEGEGWVVVSIVAGTLTSFTRGRMHATRHQLVQELQRMVATSPDNLVAFEVIWSPAADLDRMSSAELHLLYPELLAFDNLPTIARCTYCESLYAEELEKCSTCGAPREIGLKVQ